MYTIKKTRRFPPYVDDHEIARTFKCLFAHILYVGNSNGLLLLLLIVVGLNVIFKLVFTQKSFIILVNILKADEVHTTIKRRER